MKSKLKTMWLNDEDRMALAKRLVEVAKCLDDLSSNTCPVTTEKTQEAKKLVHSLHDMIETFSGDRAVEIYGKEEGL